MSKERRLGRGLEALLGRIPKRSDTADESPEKKPVIGADHRGSALGPHEKAARAAAEAENRKPQTIAAQAAIEQSQERAVAEQALPAEANPTEPAPRPTAAAPEPEVVQVDVHLIESNPFQPRTDFEADGMKSLAESIGDHGLLQPLVVRRKDGAYQLIAGERRLRAAQQAGWNEVPVKVVDADDRKASELAIVENLQRRDLNPLEKAASFQRYLQTHGCTQEELAGRLKIDRSTIANLIRLLELPDPVKDAIRSKTLTAGHARALLPLGEEHEQNEFCKRIQKEGWTVRQTEQFVQEAIDKADAEPLAVAGRVGKSRPSRPKDDQLAALEQEFRLALGTKVKLTHNARGRGKLVIQFANHDEFERLRAHLLHTDPPAAKEAG